MAIILHNGQVITPVRIIKNAGIIIKGRKIKNVFNGDNFQVDPEDKVIDVCGNYIAPGFIDIHTHGGGGHDFMDGNVKAMKEAAKAHLKYGTTSIIPTTLTSTRQDLFNTLKNFKKAKKQLQNTVNVLGLHLEGPYFSKEHKGAQDPRYIKNPDPREYKEILESSDDIIRWTIAPELDGALEMGSELTSRNILASIGHSNAVYRDVLKAFESGFRHITHFYSCMSTVRRINAYRQAGIIESAYLIDEMTVEIIADGVHLPGSLLKLIYKIKGADRICLVTDSMRAAGMPEGEYILGSLESGQKVLVEDGVAKLPDRTAFAGSVATADRLIRTMIKKADVPLRDAVKMMTLTPANIMEIDNKGIIARGKDADIVVFDDNIDIKKVIVGGNIKEIK